MVREVEIKAVSGTSEDPEIDLQPSLRRQHKEGAQNISDYEVKPQSADPMGTSTSVFHLDMVNSQKAPTQDKPAMKSHKESLARLKEKISSKRSLRISRTNANVTQNLATKAKSRLLNVSSRQTLLASNKALALALEAEKHRTSMAFNVMCELRRMCNMQLLDMAQLNRRLKIAEEKREEAQNVVATLQDLLVHLSHNNTQLLNAGLKLCARTKQVSLGQAVDVENSCGASPTKALPLKTMMREPQLMAVGMNRDDKEEVGAPEKQNECSPSNPEPIASSTSTERLHVGCADTTATETNEVTPLTMTLLQIPSSTYITSRRRKDVTAKEAPTVFTEETNAVGVTECKPPSELESNNQLVANTSPAIEKTVYSQLDMEMTCDSSIHIEVIKTNKTNPSQDSMQPSPKKAKQTAAHQDKQKNEKEGDGQSRVQPKSRKKNSSNVNKISQAKVANTETGSVARVKSSGASNVKYKTSVIEKKGPKDRVGDNDSAFDFDLEEQLYKTPFRSKSNVAIMVEEGEAFESIPCMPSPWTGSAKRTRSASSTATGASVATPKQLTDRSNEMTVATGTPPVHCLPCRQSEPQMFNTPPSLKCKRRCKSLVNYKLPSINTKLRRGDDFTDAKFLRSPIYKSGKKQKKNSKKCL